MKRILDWTPGFRSRQPGRMMLGTLYYLAALILMFTGYHLESLILFLLPFLVFGILQPLLQKLRK